MPGEYIYAKLTDERDIRLLELLAGKGSSAVTCRLRHAALYQSPKYEALSYEWRKHEGCGDVRCGSSGIEVTSNLLAALQALRYPEKSRLLWVDAICIDQKDVAERSRQIPIMRDIYARARSVIVWLGKEGPNTEAAFNVLPSLAYVWAEKMGKGMNEENPTPYTLRRRPEGASLFMSETNVIWVSHNLDSSEPYRLRRRLDLDDNEIFRFNDYKLWTTIDDLFASRYFQRTWIIQEIAVARTACVICGKYQIPWDIFRAAYGGRILFNFQEVKLSNSEHSDAAFSCVRDARLRYRNQHFVSDLASVLVTFTYSKETQPQDHIYAGLGLVKSSSMYKAIVPDYNKTVEEVFYEAATHIILDRQDLYLWGTKSLLSTRTMPGLPSWVPEWTGASSENAVEYYSPELSRCLAGRPSIRGRSLYVDGHILGRIEFVAPVGNDFETIQLIRKLDNFFKERNSGLFDAYLGGLSRSPNLTQSTSINPKDYVRFQNLANAFAIMSDFKEFPKEAQYTLKGLSVSSAHPLDNVTLNLESFWSILTRKSRTRQLKPIPAGERLFLATMCVLCMLNERPNLGSWSTHGLPKGYGPWIQTAVILAHASKGSHTSLFKLYAEHATRSLLEDDDFFLTNNGYFGRAPAGEARKDYEVAILGGGGNPYILEKHQSQYMLISHAYVEGIMDLQALPEGMKVERIELT